MKTFKCKIVRCTYEKDDFRMYAVDVDKNVYPEIKHTKYGTVTIKGEMHQLGIGQEYEITGEEQSHSQYGYSYKVTNIKKDKPHSPEEMYEFLQEILTENQARELYNTYPNIVDLVLKDDFASIDLTKLKGIGQFHFERIVEKIKSNYSVLEMVTEFKKILSMSILKRLSGAYSSVKLIKKKLAEDGYKCLTDVSGIGFKTADEILQKLNEAGAVEFDYDLMTSKQRCQSCLEYLLGENEASGNTRMGLKTLKSQCEALTPECSDHFKECILDDSFHIDKATLSIGKIHSYEIEKYIATTIKTALVSPFVWDYPIEKYRQTASGELTDEQLSVLDMVCKKSISILNGAGGVGKTYSTQAVIKMLDDNNKTYVLLAPTGKAAKVIKENTQKEASTIHRGLGYSMGVWEYNEDNKLKTDIVIIDEFSMTDIFLFEKVLKAIDFTCTKLLLIGDNAQLPSVSAGNLLHDFMQSKVIPTTTLTKVFRYGEGGLMKVATDVRLCKSYLSPSERNSLTLYGDNKDYGFINCSDDKIINNALNLYSKMLSKGYKPEDIQILTAYNKGDYGTVAINNFAQKIANKKTSDAPQFKVGDVTYYENDLVLQKKNNYKAIIDGTEDETFIANGETGKIVKIDKWFVVIDFDGVRVNYSRGNMGDVGLGYSVSIHKSQGNSSKVIILLTPSSHTFMLNSNLIYVGLTRMREKCFHLGTKEVVDRAIKKKENFDRKTWTQGLLLKNDD